MADICTGQDEPVQPKASLREVLVSLRQPKVAIAMVFDIATGMLPVMVGAALGFMG